MSQSDHVINKPAGMFDEEKGGIYRSHTAVTMSPELFEKVTPPAESFHRNSTDRRNDLTASSSTLHPRLRTWATTTRSSPTRRLWASLGMLGRLLAYLLTSDGRITGIMTDNFRTFCISGLASPLRLLVWFSWAGEELPGSHHLRKFRECSYFRKSNLKKQEKPPSKLGSNSTD